jgi:hypothetical protein
MVHALVITSAERCRSDGVDDLFHIVVARSGVDKDKLMILSDAPQSSAMKGGTLTERVAWLFEALRVTAYFDEHILRAHERLPMPERAQMARAYYHVLPLYEQIQIYRAASQSPHYQCRNRHITNHIPNNEHPELMLEKK